MSDTAFPEREPTLRAGQVFAERVRNDPEFAAVMDRLRRRFERFDTVMKAAAVAGQTASATEPFQVLAALTASADVSRVLSLLTTPPVGLMAELARLTTAPTTAEMLSACPEFNAELQEAVRRDREEMRALGFTDEQLDDMERLAYMVQVPEDRLDKMTADELWVRAKAWVDRERFRAKLSGPAPGRCDGRESDDQVTSGKVKGKEIDRKLKALILEKPAAANWTLVELAHELGCGTSTVHGTPTYQTISRIRKQEKAERAERVADTRGKARGRRP